VSDKTIRLEVPLTEKTVRGLAAGDIVLVSGLVLTARDRVHRYLFNEKPEREKNLPFPLEGGVLYHCGPVIKAGRGGVQEVVAAGPTTSARMQMYEPFVIEHYGLRAIMGKGGMDTQTLEAMQRQGCVYLNTIGGAGALLASRIKSVRGVWKLEEFGQAEAMWAFEVEDFPAVVTMDSSGGSLHRKIEDASRKKLRELLSI
jgi:fumarate hydratase class I